jgi:hypothetical protein
MDVRTQNIGWKYGDEIPRRFVFFNPCPRTLFRVGLTSGIHKRRMGILSPSLDLRSSPRIPHRLSIHQSIRSINLDRADNWLNHTEIQLTSSRTGFPSLTIASPIAAPEEVSTTRFTFFPYLCALSKTPRAPRLAGRRTAFGRGNPGEMG